MAPNIPIAVTPLLQWVRENGRTQSAIAKALGMSPVYLNDVLHGRARPGEELAGRLSAHTGGKVKPGQIRAKVKRGCCPTCGQQLPSRRGRRA